MRIRAAASKCAYPLEALLLAALSAVTRGADDRVSVVKWAQLELEWLRRFLPFDNGIASQPNTAPLHRTLAPPYRPVTVDGHGAAIMRALAHGYGLDP